MKVAKSLERSPQALFRWIACNWTPGLEPPRVKLPKNPTASKIKGRSGMVSFYFSSGLEGANNENISKQLRIWPNLPARPGHLSGYSFEHLPPLNKTSLASCQGPVRPRKSRRKLSPCVEMRRDARKLPLNIHEA